MTHVNGTGISYLSAKDLYELERSSQQGHSGGALYYVGNIGLLYPSDYGFSIKNISDTLINSNIDFNIENSWLYRSEGYWTITPEAGYFHPTYGAAVCVIKKGSISTNCAYYSSYTLLDLNKVLPTFYLKSNVFYKSGDGTKENPYRISINE